MGRAALDRLAAEGVTRLALTDISARRLDAAVAALPPGIEVAARRADVTDAAEAAAFADAVARTMPEAVADNAALPGEVAFLKAAAAAQ